MPEEIKRLDTLVIEIDYQVFKEKLMLLTYKCYGHHLFDNMLDKVEYVAEDNEDEPF
jgi:hypothetical protein